MVKPNEVCEFEKVEEEKFDRVEGRNVDEFKEGEVVELEVKASVEIHEL